jgi:hypothetical protein
MACLSVMKSSLKFACKQIDYITWGDMFIQLNPDIQQYLININHRFLYNFFNQWYNNIIRTKLV